MTAFILFCVLAYFIKPIFTLGQDPTATAKDKDKQTVSAEPQIAPTAEPTEPQDSLQQSQTNLESRLNYYKAMQQEQQIRQLERKLQLYQEQLPLDYELIKSDVNLQVRGVIKANGKCKAYNTHGDLMLLSQEQCHYYIAQSGRVHKNPQQQTQPMQQQGASYATAPPTSVQ